MLKVHWAHIAGLTLLFATAGPLRAQIYSNSADAVKTISYKTYVGDDQLFVFYQSHGAFRPGSLSADAPEAGSFAFTWTKYDPDNDDFSIAVSDETGVNSSTISDLEEGGYRVHITDGVDTDTMWTAWVMLDKLNVYNLKDANGHLPGYLSNCTEVNQLTLSGFVEIDTFYYFDPVSHDTIFYENDFDIEWSSDDPELFIPNRTNKQAMELNTTYLPPIEDTWFILTATDSMGMTEVDSVYFDSPFTKAEFEVEYWDKVNNEWNADLTAQWSKDDGSLDAPLTVKFNNKSVNGFSFEWVLLDTTNEVTLENNFVSFPTSDSSENVEFTYEKADEFYYPYLISYGDPGLSSPPCTDTFRLEDGIQVVASELTIPNYFVPVENDTSTYFKFKALSIKEFRITIADRTGNVVYRDHVYDIYEWDGWNGKNNNHDNGREVREGVYYFVIEALGYDNVEYKDPSWIDELRNNITSGGGITNGGTGQNPTGTGDEDQAPLNRYTGFVYLFR